MSINERVTSVLSIRTNISQRFFISSILYLFYNADLLNICEKLEIKINDFDFVNDVNILTYSTNTEKIRVDKISVNSSVKKFKEI